MTAAILTFPVVPRLHPDGVHTITVRLDARARAALMRIARKLGVPIEEAAAVKLAEIPWSEAAHIYHSRFVYDAGTRLVDHLALGWMLSCPFYEANGHFAWILVWPCQCEPRVPR